MNRRRIYLQEGGSEEHIALITKASMARGETEATAFSATLQAYLAAQHRPVSFLPARRYTSAGTSHGHVSVFSIYYATKG